jgi:hypothetical protein
MGLVHNVIALGEEVEISYKFVQTLKSVVSNRLGTSDNVQLRKRWTSILADIEGNWQEGAPDIVRLFDVRVEGAGDDLGHSAEEEGGDEGDSDNGGEVSENDGEVSESEVEVIDEAPTSGSKARKTGAGGKKSSGRDAKGKAKSVKEEGTPKAKKTKGEAVIFDDAKDTPWLKNVRRVWLSFSSHIAHCLSSAKNAATGRVSGPSSFQTKSVRS